MNTIDSKGILYQAKANRTRVQYFQCAGYQKPVVGTIYPRAAFRWYGVPLGGLGTGYVCWDSDGRFSQCTLFNQVPTQGSGVPNVNMIPFRLTADGQTWSMAMRGEDSQGDLRDLRYFGHFPIIDAQFEMNGPIAAEIRAFGPFLPGNSAESNTPAAVFEAYLTNTSDHMVETSLSFTPPPTPKPISNAHITDKGSYQMISVSHAWDKASPSLGARPAQHELAVAVENGQVICEGETITATFTVRLAPGETVKTHFILGWYQPYVRDGMFRAERLRYADRFANATDVIGYAIEHYCLWLDRIIAWQSAVYDRDDLPEAMIEGLVNTFYSHCKNAHWISKWRSDDWFPEDGLFMVNESYTTCSISETLPCHYAASFPMLFFFPELERSTLEAYRHFQLETGEVPFALGFGFAARTPLYQAQHTNGIGEYIEIILRYYQWTHDDGFLKDFYPSAKAALGYLEFLDTDHDGLVNEHSHALPGENFPANLPWDQWPQQGTSGYTGMKSLTSCLAMERLAQEMGDSETASRCRDRVTRGRVRLEERFWNGSYYRLSVDDATDAKNDACLMAQVNGAWAAKLLGLECPVPQDHIHTTLESISKLNDGLSPYGLVLGVNPDGSLLYSDFMINCDFPRDVWPLYNFIYTATCLYWDKPKEFAWSPALKVFETLFHAANAMPWGWPCNLSGVDGWVGHGHDYQDPAAFWTILLALSKHDLSTEADTNGLVKQIIAASNS